MAKMMADKNSEGVSIEMLPLPEWTGRYKVPTEPMSGEGEMLDDLLHRYGHAVAEHNVASRDAEIERLKVVAHGFVDEIAAKDAEIEALRAEVADARDGWHMANGAAELAMKHRDAAEARAERLAEALRIAEAALADIGDADREPGDDVEWCERRAALGLRRVRDTLRDQGADAKEARNG